MVLKREKRKKKEKKMKRKDRDTWSIDEVTHVSPPLHITHFDPIRLLEPCPTKQIPTTHPNPQFEVAAQQLNC